MQFERPGGGLGARYSHLDTGVETGGIGCYCLEIKPASWQPLDHDGYDAMVKVPT